MKTFLTPEQVAEQLSVEITTVYTWLRSARLSGVKFGRLWRVRAADVERFTQKGWQGESPRPKESNSSADATWIDALPQIDLSGLYAPDAVFRREDVYRDDEEERRLRADIVGEDGKSA